MKKHKKESRIAIRLTEEEHDRVMQKVLGLKGDQNISLIIRELLREWVETEAK